MLLDGLGFALAKVRRAQIHIGRAATDQMVSNDENGMGHGDGRSFFAATGGETMELSGQIITRVCPTAWAA